MSDEQSRLLALKQQWDEEDAARDAKEERAKRKFLEQEADQVFAPIENYLSRLAKVLLAAGASVEIGSTWEHIGDQGLRRTVKLTVAEPEQELVLDLTVQGVRILYRRKPYRFSSGTAALIGALTTDVEQFFTSRGRSQTTGA